MAIDKKKVWENMKMTFKQMGASASKVLENLEKQDKAINESISKATGGVN